MNSVIFSALVVAVLIVAGCQENEPAPANPAPQPGRILGLEEGWELAPKANYSAEQKGGQVTITATGESPTAGYQVKLVQSPLRIWPPQWLLAHKKPDGAVAQVITPYEVSASFKAQEPVEWLKVTDARGSMHVPVTRD